MVTMCPFRIAASKPSHASAVLDLVDRLTRVLERPYEDQVEFINHSSEASIKLVSRFVRVHYLLQSLQSKLLGCLVVGA